ncbi:unnamed protein product [Absidia cylindrospora]
MSSLTSPLVKKNITRFTPKVKHRDQRRSSLKSSHLPTSERATISTSSFTSQHIANSDSSTSKITEPASSTTSLPSIQSLTNSSTSIPPPKPTTSKTTATTTTTTTQSIPTPKQRSRRISSTSSNTFQPPSKGDHIAVVAPPSPEQDDKPTFSTTLPITPSPILHENDNTTNDTHPLYPQPKKRRRNTPSSSNPNNDIELVESLVTLDDITHDPAEPSLMQKPLSYFTDDLSTGVVSRSFKENERKRAITAATTGLIKKPIDNNKSANSIEILDDADDMNEIAGLQDSSSAPQVRLVDGEIVLDTSSLYIDKPLGQRKQVDYEVVEEDNTSKRINSHTYGKQHGTRGRRWTKDESALFYEGLAQHGTDFEMISTMIPNRSRREIKLMFNRQEKVCPWKITASIMKKPNSSSLQDQTTE